MTGPDAFDGVPASAPIHQPDPSAAEVWPRPGSRAERYIQRLGDVMVTVACTCLVVLATMVLLALLAVAGFLLAKVLRSAGVVRS